MLNVIINNGIANIPKGTKKIEDNAFEGYTNLTGINIPNTVKTIGKGAFLGCI